MGKAAGCVNMGGAFQTMKAISGLNAPRIAEVIVKLITMAEMV